MGILTPGINLFFIQSNRQEKTIIAESFSIESTVHGHHVYKESWSSSIGEELTLSAQPESDNVFDKFAVAVLRDNIIVGHIQWEISRLCWYFLQKRQSSIVCRITDHRRLSDVEGNGLVVPCIYIYLRREDGSCREADQSLSLTSSLVDLATSTKPAFSKSHYIHKRSLLIYYTRPPWREIISPRGIFRICPREGASSKLMLSKGASVKN